MNKKEINKILEILIIDNYSVSNSNSNKRYKIVDIESIKKLKDYIEQLQQENKQLKEDKEIISKGFCTAISDMCDYQHILSELESWLEEKYNNGYEKLYLEDILNKLKELEGSDK